MMYRYITAALIVLGLAISAGAETQGSVAMAITQCALGGATMFSGYLFSTLIDDDSEEDEEL